MSIDEDASDLEENHGDELEPLGPNMSPKEQWSHYTKYFYLLCKLLFYGALGYGTWWVMTSLGSVLFPLFISLMIAYLLDPVVDMMEEKGIPRTVGILICILLGLLLLTFVLLFLYPTLSRQIGNIANRVPQLIELVQTKTIPGSKRRLHTRCRRL